MTDRPIIFSAPMVNALLGGRKTQTRRILNSARVFATPERPAWTLRGDDLTRALQNADRFRRMDGDGWFWEADAFEWQAPSTRTGWLAHIGYAPGDRLWVRENHQFRGADYGDSGGDIEWFRAYGSGGAIDNWDPDFPSGWEPSIPDGIRELVEPDEQEPGTRGYVTKLRPSIHMPRWASRLTLIVSDVKIERLQQISDDDARAEGITKLPHGMWHWIPRSGIDPDQRGFHTPVGAFDTLWGRINGPTAWTDNPFVVVVSFNVVRANIDARSNAHGGGLSTQSPGETP